MDAIMLNFTGFDSDGVCRLNELLMKLAVCFEGIPIMANATSCEEQDASHLGAISQLNFQSINQTNVFNPASCI